MTSFSCSLVEVLYSLLDQGLGDTELDLIDVVPPSASADSASHGVPAI